MGVLRRGEGGRSIEEEEGCGGGSLEEDGNGGGGGSPAQFWREVGSRCSGTGRMKLRG
jgi:hypothetical protein